MPHFHPSVILFDPIGQLKFRPKPGNQPLASSGAAGASPAPPLLLLLLLRLLVRLDEVESPGINSHDFVGDKLVIVPKSDGHLVFRKKN